MKFETTTLNVVTLPWYMSVVFFYLHRYQERRRDGPNDVLATTHMRKVLNPTPEQTLWGQMIQVLTTQDISSETFLTRFFFSITEIHEDAQRNRISL